MAIINIYSFDWEFRRRGRGQSMLLIYYNVLVLVVLT